MDIDALLRRAMASLAEDKPHFKWTVKSQRQRAETLEEAFQVALCDKLKSLSTDSWAGWRWQREVRLPTRLLTNQEEIIVDIMGYHPQKGLVAIELKYVTMRKDGPVFLGPSDVYAFPYDVLNDCLKCDLLLAGKISCAPALTRFGVREPAEAKVAHAACIGLTNHEPYWQANDDVGNNSWARESFAILRQDPIRTKHLIRTDTTNLENSIFNRDRPHLSLGRIWQGAWHNYSSVAALPPKASRFRYVLLSPVDVGQPHDYQHNHDDPAWVPFLNPETRKECFKRQAEFGGKSGRVAARRRSSRRRPVASPSARPSSASA